MTDQLTWSPFISESQVVREGRRRGLLKSGVLRERTTGWVREMTESSEAELRHLPGCSPVFLQPRPSSVRHRADSLSVVRVSGGRTPPLCPARPSSTTTPLLCPVLNAALAAWLRQSHSQTPPPLDIYCNELTNKYPVRGPQAGQ